MNVKVKVYQIAVSGKFPLKSSPVDVSWHASIWLSRRAHELRDRNPALLHTSETEALAAEAKYRKESCNISKDGKAVTRCLYIQSCSIGNNGSFSSHKIHGLDGLQTVSKVLASRHPRLVIGLGPAISVQTDATQAAQLPKALVEQNRDLLIVH